MTEADAQDLQPESNRPTYTCAACHGVFREGWSEEEARAEAAKRFGRYVPSMAKVCDDCYKAMQARYGENFER